MRNATKQKGTATRSFFSVLQQNLSTIENIKNAPLSVCFLMFICWFWDCLFFQEDNQLTHQSSLQWQ